VTKATGAAIPRSSSPRSSTRGGSSAATPARTGKAKPQPVPPETPGVARIIAIANQKGGVGKSTTAVSLGAALADLGFRVLVIDLDPQGNASTGMGIKHEAREVTVYDVIVAEASVSDAIVDTPVPHLHALPSTIDLAGAEIELVSQFSRETRLKKALAPIREGVYDFVLLDCPPSLGLLTINALTAAEELIVPIQCEYYALEGVGQLLRNVSLVQQNINPGLRLSGIVMTMFDPRTKLSEQVVEEVQRYFGDLVYDIIIPRTVRLSEAPGYGQPITVYDPKSKGAECYRELGREVALRPPPADPMPSYDDLPEVVLPASSHPTAPAPAPLDEAELETIPTVHGVVEDAASDDEPSPTRDAQDQADAHAVADGVTDTIRSAIEDEEKAKPTSGSEPHQSLESPAEQTESKHDPAATASLPATIPVPAPATIPADADADAGAEEEDLWESDPTEATSRVSTPSTPPRPGELPERRVVVIDEDAGPSPTATQGLPPGGQQPDAGSSESGIGDIGTTLEDEDTGKRRWRLFRKGGD
jgi:chromosome partitioning protein